MSVWPLFLLQLVIFVALVVVLRYVFNQHQAKAVAHLQGLNAEYTRRHEELKQRTEQAEQQYTEQVSRAKAESEQLVRQAKQEAEASRGKLLDEARRESERIVQQGLESRDAFRKELEQAMERRAIERACELLQHSLPVELRQTLQSHWAEELIEQGLSQLDRLNADEAIQEAKLVSAFPLSSQQRQALQRRLKERLGREVGLSESTDAALVAGIVITIGSLVLDGSLSSRVQQAARNAKRES